MILWHVFDRHLVREAMLAREALSHSKSDARPLSGDNVVVLRLTLRTADIEAVLLGAPVLARAAAVVCNLHVRSIHGSKPVSYTHLRAHETS